MRRVASLFHSHFLHAMRTYKRKRKYNAISNITRWFNSGNKKRKVAKERDERACNVESAKENVS